MEQEDRFNANEVALKLSMVKAVFFDFGDTLATLSPSKEELFVRASLSVGLALDIEAVRRAYQVVDFHTKYSSVKVKNRDDFYHDYNQQLCEALGICSYFAKLQPSLMAQFKKNKRWGLIDGVPEVLSRLRARGLPLAVVANWDSNLSSLAEELGINEFFSAIVSSQAAGVEKPNPAIFRLALENLSFSIADEKILYVGNEYRADVVGARAAGLSPVLIDRSHLYQKADCPVFPSLLQWLEAAE